ncbi:MAG: MMCAP2_0565 family pilin-like conjugal transfer protein [Candidatus Saccharibacteria bacterium]
MAVFTVATASVAVVQPVHAINVFKGCSSSTAGSTAVCKDTSSSVDPLIKTLINTLLYALGIIAVIVIVVGGIKFVTSDGDPGKIKSARETILYAVVGLVVAILAYAIVQFVIGRFT